MEALFAAIEYYGRCNEVTQLRGGGIWRNDVGFAVGARLPFASRHFAVLSLVILAKKTSSRPSVRSGAAITLFRFFPSLLFCVVLCVPLQFSRSA